MTIVWDRSDDRIWYGRWASDETRGRRLYLIVERLPNRRGWDWAVWQPDGPKIARRGIEATAPEAATAAETMAFLLM